MNSIIFSFITLAYIFSGVICWLAFMSQLAQRSLVERQRFIAVLASFLIVVFWPIWIIIEIGENFRKVNKMDDKVSQESE